MRLAPAPGDAFRLGRTVSKEYPIRPDWEHAKIDVMYKALEAKFLQHDDLKQFLLSTGDSQLIEHTAKDKFWADGGGEG